MMPEREAAIEELLSRTRSACGLPRWFEDDAGIAELVALMRPAQLRATDQREADEREGST